MTTPERDQYVVECEKTIAALREQVADLKAEHRDYTVARDAHDKQMARAERAEADHAALQPLLTALRHIDWIQMILNQSAPCCHIEDGRFCGRAERWAGHEHFHKFVSLNDAIDAAMKDKP